MSLKIPAFKQTARKNGRGEEKKRMPMRNYTGNGFVHPKTVGRTGFQTLENNKENVEPEINGEKCFCFPVPSPTFQFEYGNWVPVEEEEEEEEEEAEDEEEDQVEGWSTPTKSK
ncbi:hypothetical protein RUM44_012198 [Polyplax serrata]|uniref:Uncharacterized protein n=1 Tax=Polyplax serrata TaxID=468196 RepID=A0ABR1BAL0_POLSC